MTFASACTLSFMVKRDISKAFRRVPIKAARFCLWAVSERMASPGWRNAVVCRLARPVQGMRGIARQPLAWLTLVHASCPLGRNVGDFSER